MSIPRRTGLTNDKVQVSPPMVHLVLCKRVWYLLYAFEFDIYLICLTRVALIIYMRTTDLIALRLNVKDSKLIKT